MNAIAENLFITVAVLPAAYGIVCWIRRDLNARKVASGLRQAYPDAWNDLHWLARRHPRAGVEVLVSKGLVGGPDIDAYRARDDYFEKATWVGLLLSAVLLLLVAVAKYAAGFPG